MHRFFRMGEGIVLGAVLCVLLLATACVLKAREPSAVTIKPVHSVDIVTTAEPQIDINTASAEELATLDGIGDVLAQRIVEWREENGKFASVDDLCLVSGIGGSKLEAVRDRICAR